MYFIIALVASSKSSIGEEELKLTQALASSETVTALGGPRTRLRTRLRVGCSQESLRM
jgi:hypothetical protein